MAPFRVPFSECFCLHLAGIFLVLTNPVECRSENLTSPALSNIGSTEVDVAGNASGGIGDRTWDAGVLCAVTSLNPNPRMGQAWVTVHPALPDAAGDFTIKVTGLTPSTNYTIKTYAVSATEIIYSSTSRFTTRPNESPQVKVDPSAARFFAAPGPATGFSSHTTTLLANGKILVAGGSNNLAGGALSSAQIYDPAAGGWGSTAWLSNRRFSHSATLLSDGRVLIAGGQGANLPWIGAAEIYDPATGAWGNGGTLTTPRYFHTATLLPTGKVLLTGGHNSTKGGALASSEVYDPAGGVWSVTGNLASKRKQHSATLLATGKVLIAGGSDSNGASLASAEQYDPVTGKWSFTGNLGGGRSDHTATLMKDGRVIVAGGSNNQGKLDTAEIYDPATGLWTSTTSMGTPLSDHAAVRLTDGRILIAGGTLTGSVPSGRACIYDPLLAAWSESGNLIAPRYSHTLTLMPNHHVIAVGGRGSEGPLKTVEIHGPVATAPEGAEATIGGTFHDGDGNRTVVLSASTGTVTQNNHDGTWRWVASGGDGPSTSTVQITARDPFNESARTDFAFAVTNLPPLLSLSGPASPGVNTPITLELMTTDAALADQLADFQWTLRYGDGLSSTQKASSPLLSTHSYSQAGTYAITATATDKDGGTSLVASHTITITGPPILSPPAAGFLTSTAGRLEGKVSHDGGFPLLNYGFIYSPAVVNPDPLPDGPGVVEMPVNGLFNGVFTLDLHGLTPSTAYVFKAYAANSAGQRYSYTGSFRTLPNNLPTLRADETPRFQSTGGLSTARYGHTAILLENGKVLVAGGYNDNGIGAPQNAELFDPILRGWLTITGPQLSGTNLKAIPLRDGRVFFTDGSSTTIYDPETDTRTPHLPLSIPRRNHTATLMANGRILLAGGSSGSGPSAQRAEIYDPPTQTTTPTGTLANERENHTATLLDDGRVLVAGGYSSYNAPYYFGSAEIFNPTTGSWTPAASMAFSRRYHTATKLHDGRVLVAGGAGGNGSTAEIYDPATNGWTSTGQLTNAREQAAATLLPNGALLLVGGVQSMGAYLHLKSAEIFDPARGYWTPTASLETPRRNHTSTLLQDGRVLITGGYRRDDSGDFSSVETLAGTEIYDSTNLSTKAREGTTATRKGVFYDPEGNQTVVLAASLGTISRNDGDGTWEWTGVAGDGPSAHSIIITASDIHGGATQTSFTLEIANSAPEVLISAPIAASPGIALPILFTAGEAHSSDRIAGFEWSIDYGDGSGLQRIISGTPSPFLSSHAFSRPGTYTITAAATDKDGSSSLLSSRDITIEAYKAIELWRLRHFGT